MTIKRDKPAAKAAVVQENCLDRSHINSSRGHIFGDQGSANSTISTNSHPRHNPGDLFGAGRAESSKGASKGERIETFPTETISLDNERGRDYPFYRRAFGEDHFFSSV